MAIDVYEQVTARILSVLENGTVPWRNPILGSRATGLPRNLISEKQYRGVNVFLLALTGWSQGYDSSYWLTFKQARERGGHVRKGEHSTLIVFWKEIVVEDRATTESKKVPVLRHYQVFNVEQCGGIDAPDVAPFEPREFTAIEEAEAVVKGYPGPRITTAGNRACYKPQSDEVRMPEPARFATSESYYSTLFHELAHSTGHSSRLDRGLGTNLSPFGSPDYSREELVAEMGAAFLCGHTGISPATVEQSAAYVQGWIKVLKGDKRLVVQAASAAQKAADFILYPGGPASQDVHDS